MYMDAQEPFDNPPFGPVRIGNNAPAALELLNCLYVSPHDEHREFYGSLENGLKDETWTMTDDEHLEMLQSLMPFSKQKSLHFLLEISLKKLQRLPAEMIASLVEDEALLGFCSPGIKRQVAEMNPKYFKTLVKDSLQRIFSSKVPQERIDSTKSVADVIGGSEIVFRSFSLLCCSYYVHSKSPRWASAYHAVVLKLKERAQELSKLHSLFDLASEVNNCIRKKDIALSSIQILRQELVRMITLQATTEEKDFRQRLDKYEHSTGFLSIDLLNLWERLSQKDEMAFFKEPVTDALAPGYSSIIKKPMDLSTIRQKIVDGQYSSRDDMSLDVNLMLDNCLAFNHAVKMFVDYAKKLQKDWQNIKSSARQTNTAVVQKAPKTKTPVKKVAKPAPKISNLPVKASQASNSDEDDNSDSDDSSGDDEDDDDGALLVHNRPSRVAKSKRKVVVEADSDNEDFTPSASNGEGNEDDDAEAFVPTTPLEKQLMHAWTHLFRIDTKKAFVQRVLDDFAPGYSQVIRKPMYLDLMKEKITKGEYESLDDFNKDAQLIFSNCIMFNGDDVPLGIYANKVKAQYAKYLATKQPGSKMPDVVVNHQLDASTLEAISSPMPPRSRPQQSRTPQHHTESASSPKEVLLKLWSHLVDLDTLFMFMNEVTDALAPGYSDEIEQPMYLALMKTKISENAYPTVEAFNADVNLMCDNCVLYNGDDSDYGIFAEEYREKYFKYYERHIKELTAGASSSAVARPTPMMREASSTVWEDHLLGVWTKVVTFDEQGLFLNEITNKIAKDYTKFIRRPMYMKLVKDKILQDKYRKIEDFTAEIKLIVDNCKRYNGPQSALAQYAEKFWKSYSAYIKTVSDTSKTTNAEPVSSKPVAATVASVSPSVPAKRSGTATVSSASASAGNSVVASSRDAAGGGDDDYFDRIRQAWLVVHNADVDKLFLYPVTDAIAPGYSKRIKNPIDLTTIKKKAKNQEYTSFDDFAFDVHLLFNNCAAYNGETHDVTIYGREIERKFNEHVAEAAKAMAAAARSKKSGSKPTAPAASGATGSSSEKVSSASKSAVVSPVPVVSPQVLKIALLELWNAISEADSLRIFAEKVTIPGYTKVIRKPMYLKIIETKIEEGDYKSLDEFKADVSLMFNNCEKYNGPASESDVTAYAHEVRRKYQEALSRVVKRLEPPPSSQQAPSLNKKAEPKVAAVSARPAPPVEETAVADVSSLHALKEQLVDEKYMSVSSLVASALRCAHSSRNLSIPQLRYLRDVLFDDTMLPLQRYAASVQHDPLNEVRLMDTYLLAGKSFVNKIRDNRPEDAIFGANMATVTALLTTACDFLVKLDTKQWFRKTLTDQEAPNYSKVIKQPMAISVLRDRVRNSAYRYMNDFHSDVLYIGKNCVVYNQFDAVYSAAAIEFIARWQVFYGFMQLWYPYLYQSTTASSSTGAKTAVSSTSDAQPSSVEKRIPKKRRAQVDEDDDDDVPHHADAASAAKRAKTDSSVVSFATSSTVDEANKVDVVLQRIDRLLDEVKATVPGSTTVATLTSTQLQDLTRNIRERIRAVSVQSPRYIGELCRSAVECLKTVDTKYLFASAMPHAPQVKQSQLIDLSTMLVKVGRAMYTSLEQVVTDVRNLSRNRLITEHFQGNDADHSNTDSVYALHFHHEASKILQVLQDVVDGKVSNSGPAFHVAVSVPMEVEEGEVQEDDAPAPLEESAVAPPSTAGDSTNIVQAINEPTDRGDEMDTSDNGHETANKAVSGSEVEHVSAPATAGTESDEDTVELQPRKLTSKISAMTTDLFESDEEMKEDEPDEVMIERRVENNTAVAHEVVVKKTATDNVGQPKSANPLETEAFDDDDDQEERKEAVEEAVAQPNAPSAAIATTNSSHVIQTAAATSAAVVADPYQTEAFGDDEEEEDKTVDAPKQSDVPNAAIVTQSSTTISSSTSASARTQNVVSAAFANAFQTEEFEESEDGNDSPKDTQPLVTTTSSSSSFVPVPLSNSTTIAKPAAAVNDPYQTQTFDEEEEEDAEFNISQPPRASTSTASAAPAPTTTITAPKPAPAKQTFSDPFQTESFESDAEDDNNNQTNAGSASKAPASSVSQPTAVKPVTTSSPALPPASSLVSLTSTFGGGSRIPKKKQRIVESSDDEGDATYGPSSSSSIKPTSVAATSASSRPSVNSMPKAVSSSAASASKPDLVSSSETRVSTVAHKAADAARATATPSPSIVPAAAGPPVPSETLLSCRRALEILKEQKPQQQLYQQTTGRSRLMPLPGLKTPSNSHLSWAVLLLKHAPFQTLLIKKLAQEVVAVLSRVESMEQALLFVHPEIILYTQLCLLSVSNDLELHGLDNKSTGMVAVVLRDWLPAMLASVIETGTAQDPSFETLTDRYFASPADKSQWMDKERAVKFLRELQVHLRSMWDEVLLKEQMGG